MTQHRQAAWIVAAFCTVFVPPGFAQSIVWTGAGAGNNWTDGANWQGGAAPTTGADVTTGSMRRYGINLDASASVNSLTIDDKYHEFDTANESTLTIGSGGLSKVNNGDEARFNSSLTINLGASQTWYIAGDPYYSDDNPVRVNGSITGTGIDFVKTGSGRLILNGNNSSLSGSFILSGGYLQLGHDNALGTTTLNIN
ncbi:MAG: autotransporter-associated beta strand repeat-containing protein, partial [Opitutaceae bacterium]